jgi:hypothetical protein
VRKTNPYHCVAIRFELEACDRAEGLRGKRFLSAQAPHLPLNGCDAARCQCSYQHFPDRRQQDERRTPFSSSFGWWQQDSQNDRRRRSDRRKTVQLT